MQEVYYLLWGQHHDKSGEIFARVFEREADAKEAANVIALFSPMMDVRISMMPFVRAGRSL